MKKTTIEDIEAQCAAAGLPMPPRSYENLRRVGVGTFDQEPSDPVKRIEEAQAKMHESRKRIADMKEDLPAPKVAASEDDAVDDWGGEPEAVDDGLGEAPEQPVTAHERQVARWLSAGEAKPKKIAEAIKSETGEEIPWQTVRSLMGRLKGDPARMEKAKA